MSNSDKFDEIIISAFVDGQVDNENREAIFKAMDEDEELRDRVYQIRRAKDLVQLAYSDSKPTEFSDKQFTNPLRRQCMMRIAAAFAVFAVSLGSGFAGYHYSKNTMNGTSLAELTQEENQRIILHIDESDPKQFEYTLAYTEELLNQHKNSNSAKKAQIEVVANAGGIDLLRKDYPLSENVARMMDEHDNITFIACTNAINKLRAQGFNPTMVKDVDTETAALTHIIDRLNSGWTYIKADSAVVNEKRKALRI